MEKPGNENIDHVNAAILVIGNEILSGRTVDTNSNYIAKFAHNYGINIAEIRVVQDDNNIIASNVMELSANFDYVFTTGGIGPTHDDITTDAVAQALSLKVITDTKAVELLKIQYPATNKHNQLTSSRLRMAKVPYGAELIKNPISNAPGYMIKNVIVLAGVPDIMKIMLDDIFPKLKSGRKTYSANLNIHVKESEIAELLESFALKYKEAYIGSYPFYHDSKYGVDVVITGHDKTFIHKVKQELMEAVKNI